MSIEALLQTDLDDKQRDALQRSSDLWKAQTEGRHLDDWLAHIPSLLALRKLAISYSGGGKANGRRYSDAFALFRDRYYPGMDKGSVTALLWLGEDNRLDVLKGIRETLLPGERARLNSPTTALQRVKKVIEPKDEAKAKEAKPTVKEELAKALQDVHLLEQKLARAENDGSVFDLRMGQINGPAGIGRIIADTINEDRWKRIVKETNAQFAAKKASRVAA